MAVTKTAIEFPSSTFFDSCREELQVKGYCYLRQHLSRHGGLTLDYLLTSEDEFSLLPVKPQSIWRLLVGDRHPVIHSRLDDYVLEDGEIELRDLQGKVVNGYWAADATIKMEALVFTEGKPVRGAY